MVKRLYYYISLLVAVLLTACSSDDATNNEQPLPEGMGCISITICAPETVETSTRAVEEDTDDPNRPGHDFPWEAPDHEWERLQTFRVYICSLTDGNYVVKQVISGDKSQFGEPSTDMTEHTYRTRTANLTSQPLDEGSYYIFATANFRSSEAETSTGNANDGYDDGYAVNSVINPNATKLFTNSSSYFIVGDDSQYSGMKNIPMTGKLTDDNSLKRVEVSKGVTTNAGTLMLWRVMAKMQFEFTNESNTDIRILGIEVDPINKALASTNPGIYLFSKDDLTSTANLAPVTGVTMPDEAKRDTGAVVFNAPIVNEVSQPLVLAAKNSGDTDQGKLYFYLNESNGTFTVTKNQLSLRFKIQRKKSDNQWYDEEIRYGVTTHYGNGSEGQNGFNVILTDWQLRIEPLAFVPIAGYPAKSVGNDGLTTTFGTGGMIALQPFVKKYDDDTWRDFSDSEVTFVSVHWKNANGTDVYGDTKIVQSQFNYDSQSRCIIGELNQDLVGSNYMTTFTVDVILGPTDDNDDTNDYGYSFTFNVVLQ